MKVFSEDVTPDANGISVLEKKAQPGQSEPPKISATLVPGRKMVFHFILRQYNKQGQLF